MMDARFSPWSRCVQKSGTTVAWRAVCPAPRVLTHMRHSNKTKKVHQFPVALTSLSIGQSEPKRGAVNHACATSFGAEVAACMLVAKLTTALGWSCRSPPPLLVSLIYNTDFRIRSSKMGRLCTRHIMVAPQKPRCRLGGVQPSQCAQQCLV